jgi:hypothetical protein
MARPRAYRRLLEMSEENMLRRPAEHLFCENCGADLGDIENAHRPVCHAVFCTNCAWKPECG